MQEITVTEIKERLDAGEKLHIIDVREPEEYAEFNIGAQHVPLGKILSMQVDELEEYKDEELIIHCRSGKRSAQACLFLETMGYSNCKNVTGGILAWQEAYGRQ
ncbi:MAG: rhodanese-like domain-containing protein [Sphingobacteriales bacterium]|nr:MAG: rhodanese-like domain-containing protein [Sphingobacteriales bacterium]